METKENINQTTGTMQYLFKPNQSEIKVPDEVDCKAEPAQASHISQRTK